MTRKYLVVGCGSIGRRHLRNLKTLQAGELFAFDPSAQRRAEAAQETGACPVDNFEDTLAQGMNACLICSPTSLHAAQAITASRYCDLFVEKPIAVTFAEGSSVAQAVEDNDRVCLVACNLRFHPGMVALKRALTAGNIGKPLAIRAEFGQFLPDWHPWEDYRTGYSARKDLGGGILRDAIHELDLVRWLGGEFAELEGLCGQTGSLQIETEDLGLLIGRTQKGVWCEVHVDYLQRRYSRSCKIVGTEATLLCDIPAGQTTLLTPGKPPATVCDFRAHDTNDMYLEEARHLVSSLERRDQPAQDARAAAELLRIVEQCRFLDRIP